MPATGIAFRASADYVTDGPTDTYCLNIDHPEEYPTTRGGITFGWEANQGDGGRDRSTGVDVRLAGINFIMNTGTQNSLRVDISAGEYSLRLALGDAGSAPTYQYAQLLDDTTPFATIDDTDGTPSGSFDDATGTEYTAANWPGSNATISRTFTSSILRMKLGSPTSQSFSSNVAYIQFVATAASNTIALRVLN